MPLSRSSWSARGRSEPARCWSSTTTPRIRSKPPRHGVKWSGPMNGCRWGRQGIAAWSECRPPPSPSSTLMISPTFRLSSMWLALSTALQAPIAGVFPAVHRVDPAGGRYLGAWPHRPAVTLARWPRGFALLNMFINELPVTQGAVLNTSLVREVGGFADLDYGEDWVLGARLAFGGRIRFLPQVEAVTYSPGSLSRREGRSAVLSGYDAVTREIVGSPSVPALARRLAAWLWIRRQSDQSRV